jgi:integrase
MKEVGKASGRSKSATLKRLKHELGDLNIVEADRERIVKFAIATAMRQEEISRVTWEDLNARTKMMLIRDRNNPRQKKGNDQRISLLKVSGYDAVTLIEEQRSIRANGPGRSSARGTSAKTRRSGTGYSFGAGDQGPGQAPDQLRIHRDRAPVAPYAQGACLRGYRRQSGPMARR